MPSVTPGSRVQGVVGAGQSQARQQRVWQRYREATVPGR